MSTREAIELRFVYKAGPCGFVIARHLKRKGRHCRILPFSLTILLTERRFPTGPVLAVPGRLEAIAPVCRHSALMVRNAG